MPTFQTSDSDQNLRLDVFLASHLDSRNQAADLIKQGFVKVDSQKIIKPSFLLQPAQKIQVTIPNFPSTLQPANLSLDILFEDSDVIVISKSPHLPTHPNSKSQTHSLANALVAHFQNLPNSQTLRPGIVHRLDQDTSGVLICAKTDSALRFLRNQFSERQVVKKYLALVLDQGDLPKQGTIDSPISPDSQNPTTQKISSSGKPSKTHFTILNHFPKSKSSLLEINLETGRTHQIRLHFQAINHPVLGDSKYFTPLSKQISESLKIPRQFLHSHSLKIKLPSGQIKTFEAPLSPDLQSILDQLS